MPRNNILKPLKVRGKGGGETIIMSQVTNLKRNPVDRINVLLGKFTKKLT